MSKFSIIVPVYNVAPYLRECLDSVLSQTFSNWECLCVNDGSTDESGVILDEYVKKDSRFRVFHKKNGGVASARNLALEKVLGEWVGFLDGDDLYHWDLMKVCNLVCGDFPAVDMIRFKNIIFTNRQAFVWREAVWNLRLIDYHDLLTSFILDGDFWARVYRYSKIKNIRFPNLILGEDWVWKTNVVNSLQSLLDIDVALYAYRQRIGSAMNSSLTLEKLRSMLIWSYEVLEILISSDKSVEKGMKRGRVLALTEGYSYLFFRASSTLKRDIFPFWIEVLKKVLKRKEGTWWVRFSLRLVVLTKSKVLVFVLFYIPYWLKLKGIHR